MEGFLQKFEKFIIVSLTVMMGVVVFLSTVELGWMLVRDILTPPVGLIELDEILELFGFFLLILIGIELLETIKIYMTENLLRVEVVLLVAIIAVARKVIILDIKEMSDLKLIGIAAIILALAGGFFLMRRYDLCGIPRDRRAESPASVPGGAHDDP